MYRLEKLIFFVRSNCTDWYLQLTLCALLCTPVYEHVPKELAEEPWFRTVKASEHNLEAILVEHNKRDNERILPRLRISSFHLLDPSGENLLAAPDALRQGKLDLNETSLFVTAETISVSREDMDEGRHTLALIPVVPSTQLIIEEVAATTKGKNTKEFHRNEPTTARHDACKLTVVLPAGKCLDVLGEWDGLLTVPEHVFDRDTEVRVCLQVDTHAHILCHWAAKFERYGICITLPQHVGDFESKRNTVLERLKRRSSAASTECATPPPPPSKPPVQNSVEPPQAPRKFIPPTCKQTPQSDRTQTSGETEQDKAKSDQKPRMQTRRLSRPLRDTDRCTSGAKVRRFTEPCVLERNVSGDTRRQSSETKRQSTGTRRRSEETRRRSKQTRSSERGRGTGIQKETKSPLGDEWKRRSKAALLGHARKKSKAMQKTKALDQRKVVEHTRHAAKRKATENEARDREKEVRAAVIVRETEEDAGISRRSLRSRTQIKIKADTPSEKVTYDHGNESRKDIETNQEKKSNQENESNQENDGDQENDSDQENESDQEVQPAPEYVRKPARRHDEKKTKRQDDKETRKQDDKDTRRQSVAVAKKNEREEEKSFFGTSLKQSNQSLISSESDCSEGGVLRLKRFLPRQSVQPRKIQKCHESGNLHTHTLLCPDKSLPSRNHLRTSGSVKRAVDHGKFTVSARTQLSPEKTKETEIREKETETWEKKTETRRKETETPRKETASRESKGFEEWRAQYEEASRRMQEAVTAVCSKSERSHLEIHKRVLRDLEQVSAYIRLYSVCMQLRCLSV